MGSLTKPDYYARSNSLVEHFVQSSPWSRVGDKCERTTKGKNLITYILLFATPWPVGNEIHALNGTTHTYRPPYFRAHPTSGPTLLPGGGGQTVTANVTVRLRETKIRALFLNSLRGYHAASRKKESV